MLSASFRSTYTWRKPIKSVYFDSLREVESEYEEPDSDTGWTPVTMIALSQLFPARAKGVVMVTILLQ